MKVKVFVSAILLVASLLFIASPSLAQVDFVIDPAPDNSELPNFHKLYGDEDTVVDFLLLTQQEEFCSDNIADRVFVCVFTDPIVEDAQHLYVSAPSFILLYEGTPVAVLRAEEGIAYLPDGQYQLLYFDYEIEDGMISWVLGKIVTFRIGETPAS